VGEVVGLLARWLHLASSVFLVGGAALLLLAGPTDRPTARRWESWILAACGVLVLVALGTALVTVAAQTARLESRAHAALEPAALSRLLTQTQGGIVWLVRGGLLILLGAFLAIRAEIRDRADWRAARGQIALLGTLALGLVAGASHAAAAEPGTAAAIAADVVHLVAAGVWIGGLPALALLLWLAGGAAGADARPFAVLAARRFSRTALALVSALVLSGLWSTWVQVGSVAGLLGTSHGRLLLVKLLAFAAMLALAALNRRLIPALAGDAASVGRPAMRRLSRLVTGEAALALFVLAVVAAMTVTPPARHEQPTWPLSFRLTLDNLGAAPDFRAQVMVGSQVAVLGVVALLASLALRRLRLPMLAGGAVVLVAGVAIAVPPLVSDAYPTTFQRPGVAYQASSIAEGKALFAEHCAVCHGPRAAGDGPAAATLHPRPPDLRAHHVALHTAGDIFWWISHGRPPMPAFADRLDADARWHLVNYLRALAAADAARLLSPTVEPERPWLVAPDFTFTVGPAFSRSLRDYRGRKIVLLVLYTLPASRARLIELAEAYGLLGTLEVEIVAVPTDAAPDAIRRLAGGPPIFYPVVTDGAQEITEAYRLFSPAPHAEFLIDRQGYLRAIVAAAGDARRDPNLLLAEVQRLNEEKTAPPPPAEHVH
jgi:putative copper export protein/mono/diheme cytochrome c family protein/alkyl hydroperoxide reductase subunit AhpC